MTLAAWGEEGPARWPKSMSVPGAGSLAPAHPRR